MSKCLNVIFIILPSHRTVERLKKNPLQHGFSIDIKHEVSMRFKYYIIYIILFLLLIKNPIVKFNSKFSVNLEI